MSSGSRVILGAQDAARYSQADVAFHLAVARGARNGVLYHVLETLQHIIHAWIVKNIEGYEGKPGSFHEHTPIHRAIRARDRDAARAAMGAHLGSADARLLAVLSRGLAPQAGTKAARRRAASSTRPRRLGAERSGSAGRTKPAATGASR